jgi:hypothetical protein
MAAPTDAAADAASCVRLQLDNPRPGATVPVGDYTISGRAVDTSGAAIDRVQLFLNDRNLGGTPLATATSSVGANGAFSVVADMSVGSSNNGSQSVFAYAHSTSGVEATVSVPIELGTSSGGPGAALGSAQPIVGQAGDCPEPVAPVNVISPTGSNVTGVSATTAPPETITVRIDSPNPGATISGRWEVSGRATVSSGDTVDRIQVFLGNRDLGGVALGQITAGSSPMPVPGSATLSNTLNSNGTYRLFVDFPKQNLGANTLFVYARSAQTQQEANSVTSVTVIR